MVFIVWSLGRESKAGKFGMFVLFLALALGCSVLSSSWCWLKCCNRKPPALARGNGQRKNSSCICPRTSAIHGGRA